VGGSVAIPKKEKNLLFLGSDGGKEVGFRNPKRLLDQKGSRNYRGKEGGETAKLQKKSRTNGYPAKARLQSRKKKKMGSHFGRGKGFLEGTESQNKKGSPAHTWNEGRKGGRRRPELCCIAGEQTNTSRERAASQSKRGEKGPPFSKGHVTCAVLALKPWWSGGGGPSARK